MSGRVVSFIVIALTVWTTSLRVAAGTAEFLRVCDGSDCHLLGSSTGDAVCARLKLPIETDGSIPRLWLSRAEIFLASRFNHERCESAEYFFVYENGAYAVSRVIGGVHKALRELPVLLQAKAIQENTLTCLRTNSSVRATGGSYYKLGQDPEFVVITLGGCDRPVDATVALIDLGQPGSIALTYKAPVVDVD